LLGCIQDVAESNCDSIIADYGIDYRELKHAYYFGIPMYEYDKGVIEEAILRNCTKDEVDLILESLCVNRVTDK